MYVVWKKRELKGYWCNVCFERETKRRYSLIPVIVSTYRVGGEPRQVHVGRLPSIRNCCLHNERVRTAWWEKTDETLNQLLGRRRSGNGEGLTRADARRIRLKLAEKVRPGATSRRASGAGRQRHTHGERTWRHTSFGETYNEPPWHLDRHLRVLGLSWPCRLDQVKAAFRTLAKKHHPDHGGEASIFRTIYESYQRLLMSVS